jgi:pimeloyl-ACP methyl ester carboxylesterase
MIWLLLIPILYLLALIGVSWFSLHPFRTPVFISPGAMGQPQENVEFATTDGVKIRGWWSETPDSDLVAVMAHGYMMNRCELTPLAVKLCQEGYSALLFDFRAHGKSGGKKCSFGFREAYDVAAAVRFVRSRRPNAKIVLIGSSMGSAASALALGAEPDMADALILDSSYSRLSSAISGWWRFLGGRWLSYALTPSTLVAAPLAGFNPFSVDIAKSLHRVGKPVLILHGDCDTLALPSEAVRNEAACAGPVELVWLPTCGHSEGRWVHPELYYDSLFQFLQEHQLTREHCAL